MGLDYTRTQPTQPSLYTNKVFLNKFLSTLGSKLNVNKLKRPCHIFYIKLGTYYTFEETFGCVTIRNECHRSLYDKRGQRSRKLKTCNMIYLQENISRVKTFYKEMEV